MPSITRQDLRQLMARREPYATSLYLGTETRGEQTRQNPIRMKNQIREAADRMAEAGLRPAEAHARLEPLSRLVEDDLFWQHQYGGLAAFVGSDGARTFKLPFDPGSLVSVGQRFHLKPLLPMLSHGERLYVLALSPNLVRLLHVTPDSVDRVLLKGVPESFEAYARYEEPRRSVQFHTETQPRGPAGQRAAMFHGQGVGTDEAVEKKRLVEYCRLIDRAIEPFLRDQRVPLVLAGVEPTLSAYREASGYAQLSDAVLPGSPDRKSPEDLQAEARDRLAEMLHEPRRKALARFRELEGTEFASTDLGRLLDAAHDSQVDTLLVALDVNQWGRYDPEARRTEVHASHEASDQDLLDVAAGTAWSTGATVFALPRDEMPAKVLAAGTFRYKT